MIFSVSSSTGITDSHNAMALFSTTDFSKSNVMMFERRDSYGGGERRESRPRSDPEKTVFVDNVSNETT